LKDILKLCVVEKRKRGDAYKLKGMGLAVGEK
jgi:hypothetical protein